MNVCFVSLSSGVDVEAFRRDEYILRLENEEMLEDTKSNISVNKNYLSLLEKNRFAQEFLSSMQQHETTSENNNGIGGGVEIKRNELLKNNDNSPHSNAADSDDSDSDEPGHLTIDVDNVTSTDRKNETQPLNLTVTTSCLNNNS